MKRFKTITLLVLFMLIPGISGCDSDNDKNSNNNNTDPYNYEPIEETFETADKPEFTLIELENGKTYKLLVPWNYDKDHNSDREYPLIVSLHGMGGSYYSPCIVDNEEEMKAYPGFFMAPHNPGGWGWGAEWVRDEIENLKKKYRIDEKRLYLMGYSMGGSGSYSFATAYYNEHKGLFAGIVRLAGQSQTQLADEIVQNTAVWYNIGLEDTANDRVGVARNAYEFYRTHSLNSEAIESEVSDSIDINGTVYQRLTKTLSLNSYEIFKLSEYEGIGHSPSFAFSDPEVLKWLFSRHLN